MFYLMFPTGADAGLAVKIDFCCKILGSPNHQPSESIWNAVA